MVAVVREVQIEVGLRGGRLWVQGSDASEAQLPEGSTRKDTLSLRFGERLVSCRVSGLAGSAGTNFAKSAGILWSTILLSSRRRLHL